MSLSKPKHPRSLMQIQSVGSHNSKQDWTDKKSVTRSSQVHGRSVPAIKENSVSAIELHLMGMTKRTFFTRKNVFDFLNRTEKNAKENAKKAVEEFMTASKQAE